MYKIFFKIRSNIFMILFSLWSFFVFIVFFPVLILFPNTVLKFAYVWAKGLTILAKIFCNIDFEVRGIEHTEGNEAMIIASKHQSAWETVVMYLVLKRPLYVFKKELLKIPIFGFYLRAVKCITIDRSKGTASLKSMLKQAKERVKENRQIIIYPEGTRVKPKEKSKYHSGVGAIYSATNTKVVPMVLNSGIFWPKKGSICKSGKIIFQFLPPIESGMDKREFLTHLEDVMEKASDKLIDESNAT